MNLVHIVKVLFFLSLFGLGKVSYAQFMTGPTMPFGDDDLEVGGDIFNDFNEDLDAYQILEDERFYRYGRFYSFNVGLGHTTFSGNRGLAYDDQDPSYNLSLIYFFDFQSAFIMGLEYSQHSMFVNVPTISYFREENEKIVAGPGTIEISMLRFFFGYRYYIDTADLGTAITWSNPYIVTRFEYWYQKNKFVDMSSEGTDSGGGVGMGLGIGLEFPIELKKSYIGVELLYHRVKFFDQDTHNYQALANEDWDGSGGYNDMRGDPYSVMVSYVMSW